MHPKLRRRCRRTERGETLIETLFTVALLGILSVGIVASLGTNIRVSGFDAGLAGSEATIRSYAQAWQAAPYLPCTASANPYGATQPAGFTLPTGYTATLVSPVKVWDSTTGVSSNAAFKTCPATDTGLQSLQLRVHPPTGGTQTLTILKRKP
jgi:type II secretory pathway pseudopilin PulG